MTALMKNNQKEEWNRFVIQNSGSFLQSYNWGEFQQSLGRQIWRIEKNQLKALVIKHNLPFKKSYLYCPRGPVILSSAKDPEKDQKNFLTEVKEIAKQENSIFFKLESPQDCPLGTVPEGQSLVPSVKQIQPPKILVLDIAKPEEILLAQMHPKTRYNIRLAQRKGVEIQPSSELSHNGIQTFLDLLKETAKRDKFHLHPQEYYQKMLEFLGRKGMVKLFLAKYQNQVVAANLVCFFGQRATYLHGASDYNFRQLMASHLLQWQAILEAKKLDFKYYDFWGIDEKKWPGVTRFKKSFGGQEVTYPDTFDLIFQPWWYKIYNLGRRIL